MTLRSIPDTQQMDPPSIEDYPRCDLCKSEVVHSHCNICQLRVCKTCVGEHLSDLSKKHKVMPYQQWISTPQHPKCSEHVNESCKLYCEKCKNPICVQCVDSRNHDGHKILTSEKVFEVCKVKLRKELQELEKNIYPKYEKEAHDFYSENAKFEEDFKNLKDAITTQGEAWHAEIDTIVRKHQSELVKIKDKYSSAIREYDDKLKGSMSALNKYILDLKKILESHDMSPVFTHSSRNEEFSELPCKLTISLPRFLPRKIDNQQLLEQFGSLSSLLITTE